MQAQFTTIADVAAALIDAEPAFADELTTDELYDIVRANSTGRYEDITEAEFDAMYNEAMALANSR